MKKKKQKNTDQKKTKSSKKRPSRQTENSPNRFEEATFSSQSEKRKRFSSLENIILDFFKNNEEAKIPVSIVEQVIELEHAVQRPKIKKAIQHLVVLQSINKNKGGLLSLNKNPISVAESTSQKTEKGNFARSFTGILSFNQYGTGFIRSESFPEDVKVLQKNTGLALPGDEVCFEILRGKKQDRQYGRVLEIIQRSTKEMTGTLQSEDDFSFYILPDDKGNPYDYAVSNEKLKGAQKGNKVSFRILDWTHLRSLPKAEIVEDFGKAGSNEAEIRSIMTVNKIKSDFPEEVERFVNQISTAITDEEISNRTDFRKERVFTIDPADAKDFDDALSIKRLKNGNFYLGVHIADVSFYMQRDSVLDKEAHDRALSTYLVDRVIPMLPERLSNDLCSLNPNEDKRTYSCLMEVDSTGRVVHYEITETLIRSKHRLSYEQAQEILDGAKHPYAKQINDCWELAQILLEKRKAKGSVDFETPEPHFVLDENDKPISVKVKERLAAHRLIEECMLLANQTVAIHIEKLREAHAKRKTKNLYPYLYRIHDRPDQEKLMNLSEMLSPFGIKFSVPEKGIKHSTLNKLIKEVKGTAFEFIANSLLLRSMAKAAYSPDNIGHFGLNFEFYSHFTSPIRRFPDVIVHRLLKAYSKEHYEYSFDELIKLGEWCSEREKNAMQAERESVKFKQAEYLSSRIGQDFEGVISGITEYGMYVLLDENYCEGMVRIQSLTDDYYLFDAKRHTFYGKRRGRQFRLGDKVKIRVVSVDLNQKLIDFTLSEASFEI